MYRNLQFFEKMIIFVFVYWSPQTALQKNQIPPENITLKSCGNATTSGNVCYMRKYPIWHLKRSLRLYFHRLLAVTVCLFDWSRMWGTEAFREAKKKSERHNKCLIHRQKPAGKSECRAAAVQGRSTHHPEHPPSVQRFSVCDNYSISHNDSSSGLIVTPWLSKVSAFPPSAFVFDEDWEKTFVCVTHSPAPSRSLCLRKEVLTSDCLSILRHVSPSSSSCFSLALSLTSLLLS